MPNTKVDDISVVSTRFLFIEPVRNRSLPNFISSAMDKFIIRLESLRFYSRIGVFDQERAVGNEFSVDVTVEVAATGFESENLDTTISYADIYEVVREAMSGECMLLESVAKSVAETIKQRWKSVGEVKIKISKLAAPIPGIQGVCSVEYLSAK